MSRHPLAAPFAQTLEGAQPFATRAEAEAAEKPYHMGLRPEARALEGLDSWGVAYLCQRTGELVGWLDDADGFGKRTYG